MALAGRLKLQREEQGQETGSMALALRDISALVRDHMLDNFPDMGKRSRSVMARDEKMDSGVMARGHRAGQEVSILGQHAVRRTPELS